MRVESAPGPYLTIMPDGEVISYTGFGYTTQPTVTVVDETGRILQKNPHFMQGDGPWTYPALCSKRDKADGKRRQGR